MKMTILIKLLAMMLVLTLIPLGIMGYLALQDEKAIGANAVKNAQDMGKVASEDSSKALTNLGEQMIKQKGIDVAKQMDIYIHDHPGMTLAELQADPYFKSLAIQSVGVTGYTFIVDSNSTTRVFHPNVKNIGVSLITSAQVDKQPGYQEIVDKLLGGQETFGYYTFKDPSTGAQRPKYMYIARLSQPTADGIVLGVCSSTFIDEFSEPVKQIEQKLDASTQKTVSDIQTSTESMGSGNTILMITIISMIFVIIVSFIFAMSISRPIKRLTEVADKVSMGKLDEEVDIQTNDEINDLADSFRRMINAFKMMAAMQETEEEP